MQATAFEFRNRFWIIASIFSVGFACGAVDRVNVGTALAEAILGSDARAQVQLVFLLGAFAVTGAALLRTWASAYLHSDIVHDRALHTEALVAGGPYRFTRNPLYLATCLLTVGMGLLASRLGFVVLVLGIALFTLRLIGREERELQAQGSAFDAYRRAVPRFFPSLWPRLPAGSASPRWRQAFVGELLCWGLAAATLALALTLRPRYFYLLTALSLGYYILVNVVLRRSRR